MSSAPARIVFPVVRLPGFLDAADLATLLGWTLARVGGFERSAIHYADAAGTTRISTATRDLGPARAPLTARLRERLPEILAGLGMQPFDATTELELVAHGDGARFTRHIDTGMTRGRPLIERRVSAVLYFHREPKAFEGGALRMHSLPPGEALDIVPAQNLLVAFPSFAPHEVCRVSCPTRDPADSRFAVNIWLHGPGTRAGLGRSGTRAARSPDFICWRPRAGG